MILEADEPWSFVGNHQKKQWVWLALDRDTREIVGLYIDDRSRDSARHLWNSRPAVYRQCAACYSDSREVYEAVFPKNWRRAVGKETGETNRIERLNNTFRQRISRLARKALSISKKPQIILVPSGILFITTMKISKKPWAHIRDEFNDIQFEGLPNE